MLPHRTAGLAAILILASVATAAPLALQDDAGSGADAGDTRSGAYALPEEGNFSGNLTPPGDVDWYSLDAEAGGIPTENGGTAPAQRPVCLVAYVRGHASANVTLTVPSAPEHELTGQLAPTHPVLLGLSTHGLDLALLGLEPQARTPSYGGYTFSFHAHTIENLSTGDAGLSSPAGTPPPCVGGSLAPEDPADRTTFQAEQGDTLVISLAKAGKPALDVTLVTPDGTERPTGLSDGGIGTFEIDASGAWSVEVDNQELGQASYLTGFTLVADCSHGCLMEGLEEEPRPCRPGCMHGPDPGLGLMRS